MPGTAPRCSHSQSCVSVGWAAHFPRRILGVRVFNIERRVHLADEGAEVSLCAQA